MAREEQGGPVGSIEELRRRVPAIVRRINADPRLALRAAANPILLLEELGYEISPPLRTALERRIRHAPANAERLAELERTIHDLAGERFDPGSPTELGRILFEKLALPQVPMVQELSLSRRSTGRSRLPTELPRHAAGRPKPPDPLQVLRGEHPIIEPLLEYRAIEAGQPPLATRELYERLGTDQLGGVTLRIRASVRRGGEPG
jgi:hypothetical protein